MNQQTKIAILGFGLEGQSIYRWLVDQGTDPDIINIHDQSLIKGYQGVYGNDYLKDLDQYHYTKIYRSPGVRFDQEIKTPISSATIEFFKHCPAKIIGITGTKGKGTTASLIDGILKLAGKNSYLVGNIGTPALDILNQLTPDDWVVYELSSFQLIDLNQSPDIAVCLMLGLDHQDWHRDKNEYYLAKANIFKYQSIQDLAVYKADDQNSTSLATVSLAQKRGYGPLGSGSMIEYDKLGIYFDSKLEITRSIVALPGLHNLENIAAAISATWDIIEDRSIYLEIVSSFRGLEHHIEFVAKVGGISYYDDSFATNPSSTIAAINALTENGDKIVVMIGGMDKGLDYLPLANYLSDLGQIKVLLYGQASEMIIQTFRSVGFEGYQVNEGQDFVQIVDQAKQLANAEGLQIVLLSPATSSKDMFDDYKQRGRIFSEIVKKIS